MLLQEVYLFMRLQVLLLDIHQHTSTHGKSIIVHYDSSYGGVKYIKVLFITFGLFPAVLFGTIALVNFFTLTGTSRRAIPFGTLVNFILSL